MKSKKKNYLTYLNDNYFYEIGFEKKESKLKDLKMKKRQYRSNQGRSPKQECETQKLYFICVLGLILTVIYLILK
tara:strand:+ start:259 stop:483 length:225 start_codon:yes stop_codon:yes gene_type:complete